MLEAERGVDHFICLGDVINYGPWSNECVDLLESLPAVRLIGNHEEDFLSGTYSGGSALVKSFYDTCIQSFSRGVQIRRYEKQYELEKFICTHTILNSYIYPDTVIEVKGNYFIGHSHYQFNRRENGYHIVNVGSVGQNREEINVINYAIYKPEVDEIELKSLIYDVEPVIRKMRELKYPRECLDYYLSKPRHV